MTTFSFDLPPGLAGRYEALGELGRGGFGVVYRARDLQLGRDVAIKLLHGRPEEELRKRFEREARGLARMRHPGIVEVFRAGEEAGVPFMVMELLSGQDLSAPLPPGADPLAIMAAAAVALDALHAAGLVHRDVKPANLFLEDDGRVLLTDFGLIEDPDLTALTATGAIPGTLGFLSPERIRGAASAPSDDWWAWGLSLYVVAEGRLPWSRDQLIGMAVGGQELPEPAFARTATNDPLREAVLAALDPEPDRRRERLEGLLYPEPEPLGGPPPSDSRPGQTPTPGAAPASGAALAARRPRVLAAGAALLALMTLAAAWTKRPKPADRAGPGTRSVFGPEFQRRALGDLERMLASRDLEDPEAWAGELHSLPPLGALIRWIDGGGRAEALAPEDRAVLRDVGEALRDRGLEAAVVPILVTSPSAAPLPWTDDLSWASDGAGASPEVFVGWLAEAIRQARSVLATAASLDGELESYGAGKVPAYPFPFDPDSSPGIVSLELLRGLLVRRAETRIRSRRWLRLGVSQVHRFVVLLVRSLRDEPATRFVALRVGDVVLRRSMTLWHSWIGLRAEPSLLMGRTPRSPHDWRFTAQVLRNQVQVLRAAGFDWTPAIQRRALALKRGLMLPPEADSGPSRALTVRRLLDTLAELQDDIGVLELFRREVDVVLSSPSEATVIRALEVYLRNLRRHPERVLASGPRARVRRWIEEHRAAWAAKAGFDEGELRALLEP